MTIATLERSAPANQIESMFAAPVNETRAPATRSREEMEGYTRVVGPTFIGFLNPDYGRVDTVKTLSLLVSVEMIAGMAGYQPTSCDSNADFAKAIAGLFTDSGRPLSYIGGSPKNHQDQKSAKGNKARGQRHGRSQKGWTRRSQALNIRLPREVKLNDRLSFTQFWAQLGFNTNELTVSEFAQVFLGWCGIKQISHRMIVNLGRNLAAFKGQPALDRNQQVVLGITARDVSSKKTTLVRASYYRVEGSKLVPTGNVNSVPEGAYVYIMLDAGSDKAVFQAVLNAVRNGGVVDWNDLGLKRHQVTASERLGAMVFGLIETTKQIIAAHNNTGLKSEIVAIEKAAGELQARITKLSQSYEIHGDVSPAALGLATTSSCHQGTAGAISHAFPRATATLPTV